METEVAIPARHAHVVLDLFRAWFERSGETAGADEADRRAYGFAAEELAMGSETGDTSVPAEIAATARVRVREFLSEWSISFSGGPHPGPYPEEAEESLAAFDAALPLNQFGR